MGEEKKSPGIYFERIDKFGAPVKYPAWRYHPLYEPIIVKNTEEDREALNKGWKDPSVPITAMQGFSNFYHDLEDMNARQLSKYAKDEYGADLPIEAGKAKLLWALWKIAAGAPKNKDRVVLLAQSIRMNLDETQSEITRKAGELTECEEITREEVWL
jgi:hypothetical protein